MAKSKNLCFASFSSLPPALSKFLFAARRLRQQSKPVWRLRLGLEAGDSFASQQTALYLWTASFHMLSHCILSKCHVFVADMEAFINEFMFFLLLLRYRNSLCLGERSQKQNYVIFLPDYHALVKCEDPMDLMFSMQSANARPRLFHCSFFVGQVSYQKWPCWRIRRKFE